MYRRYRFFLFLMLLWLPVKGVLSAAMPFQGMAAQSAAEKAHCPMQAMMESDVMESDDVAPMSHADHDTGGHGDYGGHGQSITCHGMCAVFLTTDIAFPLTAEAVDAPLSVKVAFYSYIPALLERPPLL